MFLTFIRTLLKQSHVDCIKYECMSFKNNVTGWHIRYNMKINHESKPRHEQLIISVSFISWKVLNCPSFFMIMKFVYCDMLFSHEME